MPGWATLGSHCSQSHKRLFLAVWNTWLHCCLSHLKKSHVNYGHTMPGTATLGSIYIASSITGDISNYYCVVWKVETPLWPGQVSHAAQKWPVCVFEWVGNCVTWPGIPCNVLDVFFGRLGHNPFCLLRVFQKAGTPVSLGQVFSAYHEESKKCLYLNRDLDLLLGPQCVMQVRILWSRNKCLQCGTSGIKFCSLELKSTLFRVPAGKQARNFCSFGKRICLSNRGIPCL